MRRMMCLLLLLALAACSNPDRYPTEKDGGIGGTGIAAE